MLVPQMILSGRYEFGDMSCECSVELPSLSAQQWQDLELRFTTEPSPRSALCPAQLGFFINDTNATNALVEAIIATITEAGFERVRQKYFELAKASQYVEHKSIPARSSFAIYSENSYLQHIPTSRLRDLIDLTGDTEFGYGQNLSITNFLFKHIDLQPISLLKLAKVVGIELSDCRAFTFTYGPYRAFDPGWTPREPRGVIAYSIEFVPASDDQAILASIQDQVELIGERLSVNNGPIFANLVAIKNTLEKLSVLLQDCTRAVGTPSDIAGIEKSLGDIRRALHI